MYLSGTPNIWLLARSLFIMVRYCCAYLRAFFFKSLKLGSIPYLFCRKNMTRRVIWKFLKYWVGRVFPMRPCSVDQCRTLNTYESRQHLRIGSLTDWIAHYQNSTFATTSSTYQWTNSLVQFSKEVQKLGHCRARPEIKSWISGLFQWRRHV